MAARRATFAGWTSDASFTAHVRAAQKINATKGIERRARCVECSRGFPHAAFARGHLLRGEDRVDAAVRGDTYTVRERFGRTKCPTGAAPACRGGVRGDAHVRVRDSREWMGSIAGREGDKRHP